MKGLGLGLGYGGWPSTETLTSLAGVGARLPTPRPVVLPRILLYKDTGPAERTAGSWQHQ